MNIFSLFLFYFPTNPESLKILAFLFFSTKTLCFYFCRCPVLRFPTKKRAFLKRAELFFNEVFLFLPFPFWQSVSRQFPKGKKRKKAAEQPIASLPKRKNFFCSQKKVAPLPKNSIKRKSEKI